MDTVTWINWFIAGYSTLLLVLILRMKKTDPMFGCDKYKRIGCNKVSGRDCGYPDCATLEKFRARD